MIPINVRKFLITVILLGLTGCADIKADLQDDVTSENASLSESLHSGEDDPGEVLRLSSDGAVSEEAPEAETSDGETPDETVSEVMSSESGGDSQVPSALIPAVMIDGTIYYLSQGYPISDQEINPDQADYTIGEVPPGTFPENDGESNYAPEGTAYVKYGNGYALKIERYGWTLFLTWEDRLAEE